MSRYETTKKAFDSFNAQAKASREGMVIKRGGNRPSRSATLYGPDNGWVIKNFSAA